MIPKSRMRFSLSKPCASVRLIDFLLVMMAADIFNLRQKYEHKYEGFDLAREKTVLEGELSIRSQKSFIFIIISP